MTLTPKPDTGLLSSVQLAWDAFKGVPLRFAVYAHGDSSPVIELTATGITYGAVPSGIFSISPPGGAKVVKVGTPATAVANARTKHARRNGRGRHVAVTGAQAVQSHLSFTLSVARHARRDAARQRQAAALRP